MQRALVAPSPSELASYSATPKYRVGDTFVDENGYVYGYVKNVDTLNATAGLVAYGSLTDCGTVYADITNSCKTGVGVFKSAIPAGQYGFVQISGAATVTSVDACSAGDPLYVDQGGAGKFEKAATGNWQIGAVALASISAGGSGLARIDLSHPYWGA